MKLNFDEKRKKIFQQFLYAERLRFSALLSKTKIKSNLLAYFLKKMVSEGLLEKENEQYKLSEKAEKMIPFFVPDSERISPLVVILVALVHEGKVLLIKRHERPYKGLWGILSGRLLIQESIEEAASRIISEKAYTKCEYCGVKSVVYERVSEGNKAKHGFVFFLVEAKPKNISEINEKDFLKWFELKKLSKRSMIASDYWMLKNHLNLGASVFEERMEQGKTSAKMRLEHV